jgi:hypothetical protein
MINSGILEESHLGDKIMCCIVLYNQAIKYQSKIKVSCGENTKKIINLLGFNDRLIVSNFQFNTNTSIKYFMKGLEKTEVFCLNYPLIFFEKIPLKIEKSILPPKRLIQGTKTFFQMDNRSHGEFKKPLSKKEKIYWARKYDDACGIGGKDTKRMLPFPYELGNLESIICKMREAKKFFGVDSGMSHVAGALGIPSDIIITHTRKKDILDISALYNKLYDNVSIRGRLKAF